MNDPERYVGAQEENLLQQQPGEPIDFFAMRAFVVALHRVDENVARAMIHWISDKGFHELINRRRRDDAAKSEGK